MLGGGELLVGQHAGGVQFAQLLQLRRQVRRAGPRGGRRRRSGRRGRRLGRILRLGRIPWRRRVARRRIALRRRVALPVAGRRRRLLLLHLVDLGLLLGQLLLHRLLLRRIRRLLLRGGLLP